MEELLDIPVELLPTIEEIEAEELRRDFHEFVVQAFNVVEPETPFEDNWHIEAICEYLQALYEDRLPSNRLIMNVPPGHMKSMLTNVFFPAWAWTRKPSLKFLCYSYSSGLTLRDSDKCKKLVKSDWYRARFEAEVNQMRDTREEWHTLDGGYRICFGLGGSLGGHRGDYALIDDPLEMTKAHSEPTRKMVNNAFDEGISSRGTDPDRFKIVIIMQRLHEDDLIGHVLEKKDVPWETLVLPAEYEGPRFASSIGFTDPRTQNGQLLWPSRFSQQWLVVQKSILGERGTASQLQQRPSPVEGNIFKTTYFKERVTTWPTIVAFYISWDTASSLEESAALSACVVGAMTAEYQLIVVNAEEQKLDIVDLTNWMKKIAYPYMNAQDLEIVIENKDSGKQAIQILWRCGDEWIEDAVQPFTPTGSKEERAARAAVWCENGSVLLPPPSANHPWLHHFEERIFNFPQQKSRDMGDAFSQLILWNENRLAEGLAQRLGRVE